jgi:hypothetical protein
VTINNEKKFENVSTERVKSGSFYTENPRNISAKKCRKLIQAAGAEQGIRRPNFNFLV